MILPKISNRFHQYIASLFEHNGCLVHQMGGIEDHIHAFISMPKTETLSKIINDVKSNSSRWLKTLDPNYKTFGWQSGYGAFSVSQSSFDAIVNYIANQEAHHKKISFEQEYVTLIKKNKIPYNPQYLWD